MWRRGVHSLRRDVYSVRDMEGRIAPLAYDEPGAPCNGGASRSDLATTPLCQVHQNDHVPRDRGGEWCERDRVFAGASVTRVFSRGSVSLLLLISLTGAAVPLWAQVVDLDDLPNYGVEAVVEFGAIDHPVHAFSRIGGLAVGPDHQLYISQPEHGDVVVLTPEGDLVRRIGRAGDGPGEFRSPGTVGWHGDTLWVTDAVSRRITWFHGGELVRSVRPPGVETTRAESALVTYPAPGGSAIVLVRRNPGPQGLASNHNGYLIRIGPEEEGADTIGVLHENYPVNSYIGLTSTSPLFHDYPRHRVHRSGEWVVVVDRPFPEGDRGELRVHRVEHTGDTTYSVRLEGDAVPLEDSHWDERMEGRSFTRISPSDFLAAQRRPANHAPASRLVVGGDGWIWIAREDLPEAVNREWVALDPGGTPRFRTTLPGDFQLADTNGGRLWGVIPGRFDEPIVRSYRVRP